MQVDLMRLLVALRKSVLFLNYNFERGFGQKKIINIWWQGRSGNAELNLLLAYLIQRHGDWIGGETLAIRIALADDDQELESQPVDDLEFALKIEKTEPA